MYARFPDTFIDFSTFIQQHDFTYIACIYLLFIYFFIHLFCCVINLSLSVPVAARSKA